MTVEIIDTIFTDIFLLVFGILFVIALFKEWGDDNGNHRKDIIVYTHRQYFFRSNICCYMV